MSSSDEGNLRYTTKRSVIFIMMSATATSAKYFIKFCYTSSAILIVLDVIDAEVTARNTASQSQLERSLLTYRCDATASASKCKPVACGL